MGDVVCNAMVLLQLLTELGGKKFLLSVDKDCVYRELFKQIADKLEISSPALKGYQVSQLQGRDGGPIKDVPISDQTLDLERCGGGIYLWVRPGSMDEPVQSNEQGPEDTNEASAVAESSPAAAPEAQESPKQDSERTAPRKERGAPPVRAEPVPTQLVSPWNDAAASTARKTRSPALAIRTEEYDVEYDKYCPMTAKIEDKRYPVRYATVRNDPHTHPRVTTLARPDGSKQRHSECLREGYAWTSVGKYHGMAEHITKYNRSGRFKPAPTYPRFAPETEEEKIKRIFKETIKAREKQALKSGGSPRSKAAQDQTNKLLMEALKSSKQPQKS